MVYLLYFQIVQTQKEKAADKGQSQGKCAGGQRQQIGVGRGLRHLLRIGNDTQPGRENNTFPTKIPAGEHQPAAGCIRSEAEAALGQLDSVPGQQGGAMENFSVIYIERDFQAGSFKRQHCIAGKLR